MSPTVRAGQLVRVLDVGCGPGLYVDAFQAAGFNAIGIDPDPTLEATAYLRRMSVFADAYLQLFETQGFDLTVCLEVAEHLPAHRSDELVGRLCMPAPLVLFSAAAPGQGGVGHINLRPKGEWVRLFAEHGFQYDAEATERFLTFLVLGPHMGWLLQNGMVLRSYGAISFETIKEEEGPQAARIAEYLPTLLRTPNGT